MRKELYCPAPYFAFTGGVGCDEAARVYTNPPFAPHPNLDEWFGLFSSLAGHFRLPSLVVTCVQVRSSWTTVLPILWCRLARTEIRALLLAEARIEAALVTGSRPRNINPKAKMERR